MRKKPNYVIRPAVKTKVLKVRVGHDRKTDHALALQLAELIPYALLAYGLFAVTKLLVGS